MKIVEILIVKNIVNTCCMVLVSSITLHVVKLQLFLGENNYMASSQWKTKIIVGCCIDFSQWLYL